MNQLAAALLFLGVLSGVAHASTPYAWEAVGNPNTLTKHCLCRLIRNGGWPVDHVIQNSLLIKPCFKYCRGQLGDGAELCAVYKREHNGQWALANRQPDGSDTCDMYVRTDKTLAEWATARTANPPTSQERKTIHMFWWGDPTADKHRQSAMLGATALEAELHQHGYTIKYHHQKTATAFTDGKVPSLPSNVQQVTIGSGGDIASVGNYLDGTDLSTNVDAVNAIVGSYAFYGVKGFAALKDLAILCILYKQGGIFLDTSVQIFDGTSHQELDAALTAFTDDSFPKYPLLWDRSQIEFVKSAAGNTVPFYKIEYNGAWVPKNHPATKTTILQYIALAAKLGLNTGGQSSVAEVHRKWTVVDRGHARMVGETIRSAVVTGLGTFAHDAPVNTAYLVFDTERPMKSDGLTTDGSRLRFTPMKITKIYGGLWKEPAVKTPVTTTKTTTVLEELDELANDIDLL